MVIFEIDITREDCFK